MKVDIKKVVFTGDSLIDNVWTADAFDVNYARWTDIIAKELEIEYVNTAIGGDTIDNISRNINDRILKYNPTLVIFDGGGNDVANGTAKTAEDAINDIVYISTVLQESGCDMIYIFFPVDWRSTDLNNKYAGIKSGVKSSFNARGIKFLDMSTTLGSVGNVKTSMFLDDRVHHNQKGQMVVAKKISEELQNWFKVK